MALPNLASKAQIIVNPTGVGISLHYFAAPGTPVIELKYPLKYVDVVPYVTKAIGQSYYEIYGAAQANHTGNSL